MSRHDGGRIQQSLVRQLMKCARLSFWTCGSLRRYSNLLSVIFILFFRRGRASAYTGEDARTYTTRVWTPVPTRVDCAPLILPETDIALLHEKSPFA